MIDKKSLKTGFYGGNDRWLTDAQLAQMADHLCDIPKIWNLLRDITDNDRIEGDLEKYLRSEMREFVIKNGWIGTGADQIALAHEVLRPQARHYQNRRSLNIR